MFDALKSCHFTDHATTPRAPFSKVKNSAHGNIRRNFPLIFEEASIDLVKAMALKQLAHGRPFERDCIFIISYRLTAHI